MNIFVDLDGTLLDSRTRLYRLYADLVPENRLTSAEYWAHKRVPRSHEWLLENLHAFPAEKISAFTSSFLANIETPSYLSLDAPQAFAAQALELLQQQGRLYVLTARQSKQAVHEQLARLRLDSLLSGVLVTGRGRTKAQAVRDARIPLSPEDLLVGDTGEDVETARELGIGAIAVASGFRVAAYLTACKPDALYANVFEFAERHFTKFAPSHPARFMTMTVSAELQRLDAIAANSHYAEGMNTASIAHAFGIFGRFVRPGPILELGPAEGVMTDRLAGLGQPLTVVEGGKVFCEAIAARHPEVDVVHSLFEDYRPSERFGTIVLGHVLEHVEDPVAILKQVAGWLAPAGRVLASVPNARSLHRQAAVTMRLLPAEDALNEMDGWQGHRRVYNPESFRREFIAAGFDVEVFGGYWLKPLANSQLEAWFTPEMIEAFMQLGERYPDIAGEIYVVAKTSQRG